MLAADVSVYAIAAAVRARHRTYRIEASQCHHLPWSWELTLECDDTQRSYTPCSDKGSETKYQQAVHALSGEDGVKEDEEGKLRKAYRCDV